MLFTSLEFIFAFLPATFAGFFLIARFIGREAAAFWLAAASVFFYGWWSTTYIPLLLGSIAFNYSAGYLISRYRNAIPSIAKGALIVGVVGDLLLLGFYKYTDFFLEGISTATGTDPSLLNLVLPLGISFFTFTQIAFLIDAWRGKAEEYSFWHYLLFVTWFPHLIAGPILHHGQMMPQFRDPEVYRIRSRNITIGLVLFTAGLTKKLLLADPISFYADPVFDAALAGEAIGFYIAWTGALAYTLQIYFDFSGYSDMAVGLSMMFGIRLPINFNSPYKANNIIEFWRRWHMTLSQFLRDYLYIPLGGNRHGESRRLVNLMLTMLLGGLWHGANWTFVVWGALHGAFLCINHLFQKVVGQATNQYYLPKVLSAPLSVAFTFFLVVVAWVFFRAEDVSSATTIVTSMAGLNPEAAWASIFKGQSAFLFAGYLLVSAVVVWCFPNIYEVIDLLENRFNVQAFERHKASDALCVSSAVLCMVILSVSILSTFGALATSPFLYFQF